MKIALMNEFSQAPKNTIILEQLKDVVEPMGHAVYNTAMAKPLLDKDVPEAYTEENPRLTYLHLGIQACLLLNSGAVDFVVTGCGTGQGALMSLERVSGRCLRLLHRTVRRLPVLADQQRQRTVDPLCQRLRLGRRAEHPHDF